MNHDKATEEFFRLRGWEQFTDKEDDGSGHGRNQWVTGWRDPDDNERTNLPKICESMTDWIKYVAEFMEGEGFIFYSLLAHIEWRGIDKNYKTSRYTMHIKDHQILYASVLAANEYLKGRQNDKS